MQVLGPNRTLFLIVVSSDGRLQALLRHANIFATNLVAFCNRVDTSSSETLSLSRFVQVLLLHQTVSIICAGG